MDAKAVLLFVIIPLCLLAGLVTMGIKQWKELREVDTQGGDEAAPGREATALPTRARAPAKSRRPPRLIRAGAKHESRCQWAAALEQYEESARLDDQPETRAKIRAVRYIQTALELEKENKGWDRAAGAYRLALADCANKEFVQRRINYCECIEPFTKAYEEGKALESAGQWQQSLSAYRESEGHAAKGDIESDLAERIKAVEAKLAAALAKERRLKTRMGRLLGMLVDQKKWRGALLACAFYSASPEHAEFAATIEATRVVAAKAAEADRAAHPLRAEGQTFDFLVMEDGTERRGMLLDRGDRVCKFRVMERLGEQTIMEVMKNVARIEKRQVSAKQLLHEEALTLLEQAVEALKEKRTLETAELLGRVCLDYPDVPLGKDQVLQSQVLTLNNPEIGAQIGDTLFSLAGRAVQIVNWDRTHQYCGQCGTPTETVSFERAKECPNCKLTSYPRLSPAIIIAVTRCMGDEKRILLARNHRFPPGRYSVVAGFVEPGESLEDTARREVFEEVGIRIQNIRYFDSQPWPFPNSLMLGFTAEYESGDFVLEEEEIADAQWFAADDLPRLPPKISIARRLIDAFVSANGGGPVREW